jgi:hypothetical protein
MTESAGRTQSDANRFALPATEVEHIIVSDQTAAVLVRSSLGERSITVRDLQTGAEVLRRPIAGAATFGFDRRVLAYVTKAGVAVVDLQSGAEHQAVPLDTGEAATEMCLNAGALHVIVTSTDSTQAVISTRIGDSPSLSNPRRMVVGRLDAPRLLCAGARTVIWSEASDLILVSDGVTEESIPRRDLVPAAVSDVALYAIDAARTLVRKSPQDEDWFPIYRSPAATVVPSVAVEESGDVASLVEQAATGAADLVSVSASGEVIARVRLGTDGAWDRPDLWGLSGRTMVSTGNLDGRLWVVVREYAMPAGPSASSTATNSDPADSGPRALLWLERQLGPVYRTRNGLHGRLIDSYEDERRVGWTYDSALAAIALAAWERTAEAKELLTGLAEIQNEDGSWEFAHEADRLLPIRGERYVGSIAWVVMAANFYQLKTGDQTFGAMADRALQFISRFIARDSATGPTGGVSMGPVAPQTYSTEHNVDTYSAFRWRSRLTGRKDYADVADGIREFILKDLTSTDSEIPPHFKVGHRDSTLYLDPQSWTALAVHDAPELQARVRSALAVAEARLRVESGRLGDLTGLQGFRDSQLAGIGKVWPEGTEGMVAAFLAVGDFDRARLYHAATARVQTRSGGIPYATENSEGWTVNASVAGTAWFLLNESWPPVNPFQPDPRDWLRAYGDVPPLAAQVARP